MLDHHILQSLLPIEGVLRILMHKCKSLAEEASQDDYISVHDAAQQLYLSRGYIVKNSGCYNRPKYQTENESSQIRDILRMMDHSKIRNHKKEP